MSERVWADLLIEISNHTAYATQSLEAYAGIALAILLVGATGPSISLIALAWWWSVLDVVFCLLSVLFLALTCSMDPGALQQIYRPDDIILKLDQHVVITGCRTLHHQGHNYVCSPNGFWSRSLPGAHKYIPTSCGTRFEASCLLNSILLFGRSVSDDAMGSTHDELACGEAADNK
jgi:hypothetical protein